MKSKILVLGCNGMLGHMVSLYFSEKGYEVIGLARQQSKIIPTIILDATEFDEIKEVIDKGNYDYIINCIGILNTACDKDPCNAILLNSYLPHFLAKITENLKTKVIHISTDCVFSGSKGEYTVDDIKDAQSMYGLSKSLGELKDSKNITIRTSIIGPDLNEKGIGLFNWFTHQKGEVNGFNNVYWTGLTTLECAKVIETVIETNLSGIYNAVPNTKISKYDLLCLIKKHFNIDIKINKIDEPFSDKSLVNNFVYYILDYEPMITDLAEWVNSHEIYRR